MWRTIVSQTYAKNAAVDTSAYSNNGIPIQVTPGFPGFLFKQPDGRWLLARDANTLSPVAS